jgi:hypothetical protein
MPFGFPIIAMPNGNVEAEARRSNKWVSRILSFLVVPDSFAGLFLEPKPGVLPWAQISTSGLMRFTLCRKGFF